MFRRQTVKNFIRTKTTFENVCHAVVGCGRKILTYVHRLQNSFWRIPNYWPSTPPLHQASVSSTSPHTKGVHTRRAVREWPVGGQYFDISEDARHWIGLVQYSIIPLRLWCTKYVCVFAYYEPKDTLRKWLTSKVYMPVKTISSSFMCPARLQEESHTHSRLGKVSL